MKTCRIFPSKTSFSPDDKDAYFGEPDLFTPQYDEALISITFTKDIDKGKKLAEVWRSNARKVIVGGVAIDGESDEPFVAGKFLRHGITITSRGCPNKCPWCICKEKSLKEMREFPEGNIIQDNNFLACSKEHRRKVFDMLKKQKAIRFLGGLENCRVTEEIADEFAGLRISELWLACDHEGALPSLRKAVSILQSRGFKRDKLRCFTMIGKDKQKDAERVKEVWDIGCMPFAQLETPIDGTTKEYDKEWTDMRRKFQRPAIMRSIFKSA